MSETKTALIIGATGGFGHAAAEALLRHGWRIKAVNRNPDKAALIPIANGRVEWLKGDALNGADIAAAAERARVIVHAANPPMYRNWPGLVMPMLNNTIEAAKRSGARIVLPGNVYNFPVQGPLFRAEDAPQDAPSRKGKIRVQMETALREAQKDGVASLILRAGDFFGPSLTANSWFSSALVKPGQPVRSITYPGRKGISHAWAYLPDLAETVARLLAQEERLGRHEVFHFGGQWLEDDFQITHLIQRAAGAPNARTRRFPWWAVGLASPFVPLMRELWEMRYLWQIPLLLDNAKLKTFLGEEPHTPFEDAIRLSLIGLGCLPDSSSRTKAASNQPALLHGGGNET